MGYPLAQDAYTLLPSHPRPQLREQIRWFHLLPLLFVAPYLKSTALNWLPVPVPAFVSEGLSRCAQFDQPAAFRAQLAFEDRQANDRFVPGTKDVLLVNGTIWTGLQYGNEIIEHGSVLLRNGLIHAVGQQADALLSTLSKFERKSVEEIDLEGRWVSPGIVDIHSHLGVDSTPELRGNDDTNSLKAPILPYLRSIDGLNTHDAAYNLSISGGITTALVLPGSANNIGGQAFTIKPRLTEANTPSSMQVDPPFVIDEQNGGIVRTGHWRHFKHATGENIHGVYNDNRFDQAYNFRKAYSSAAALKTKQDAWCTVGKENTEEFPDSLEWEALVDVLRGNAKVNIHSYVTVDFDELVRLSNEFKFNIASVHHAHEAYLVPDLLKKTYGGAPAASIFATNKHYKAEAFRGSEFAPKLLADAGIHVIMKSDHPVLDSRHLVYEAQQAHYYGLHAAIALSAVTTTPARVMGLDHRLGSIRRGNDADLVVWDSHPLNLAATPVQVYIDGIAQLEAPKLASHSKSHLQKAPKSPDWGDEAEIHKRARGDPDYAKLLHGRAASQGDIAFTGVKHVWTRGEDGLTTLGDEDESSKIVVIRGGKIVHVGKFDSAEIMTAVAGLELVDLKNGSIVPGMVSYGAPLGLGEIVAEKSTMDGKAPGGDDLILAADGASFATKDALIAARAGVSIGISAPLSSGPVAGLSFAFSTGAPHPLAPHAVLQEVTALHVTVGHDASGSISSQIGDLRKRLLGKGEDTEGWWAKATAGEIPLVIEVEKADIMARLIKVKKEVESKNGTELRVVFSGASEAHLIVDDIATANIGVLVAARPFPGSWDKRRTHAGLPLTSKSAVDILVEAGITVGLRISESWEARNARFEAGWALLNSHSLDPKSAYQLVSANVEKLLGLKPAKAFVQADWVAVAGDLFSFEGQVVARGGAGEDGEGVALFH